MGLSPVSPVSHYQCLQQSPQQPLLPLQVPAQYGPGPGQQLQEHGLTPGLNPGLTSEQLGQLAIASLAAGGGKKRPRESGDELLLVSITSFSSPVFPSASPADGKTGRASLLVSQCLHSQRTRLVALQPEQFSEFCCHQCRVVVWCCGVAGCSKSLTYSFPLPHNKS